MDIKRLKDRSKQIYITQKYFDGFMPWDEENLIEHIECRGNKDGILG